MSDSWSFEWFLHRDNDAVIVFKISVVVVVIECDDVMVVDVDCGGMVGGEVVGSSSIFGNGRMGGSGGGVVG